jgi:hypothetical protein
MQDMINGKRKEDIPEEWNEEPIGLSKFKLNKITANYQTHHS